MAQSYFVSVPSPQPHTQTCPHTTLTPLVSVSTTTAQASYDVDVPFAVQVCSLEGVEARRRLPEFLRK